MPGGSTAARDIHAGSTYQFLLYSDRAPDVLLASVTVTRERPYLLWLGVQKYTINARRHTSEAEPDDPSDDDKEG